MPRFPSTVPHARRAPLRSIAACAALVLSVLLPTTTLAWSGAGHRMIAELAERQLSPAARAEAQRLLAVRGAAHLADVATWPDELRDDPKQRALSKATSRLHFINFADSTCRYDAARDCAGGQCVVGGVATYAAILGDRTKPDAERADALSFVVHFVGDAHQPLHAGYRTDRGGNDYQVQLDGKGTNLHTVWDSRILGSRRIGWSDYAERLAKEPRLKVAGMPRDWAEESCRITRDDGVYPSKHKLESSYPVTMRPLAERRVREAATRLAATLERALVR